MPSDLIRTAAALGLLTMLLVAMLLLGTRRPNAPRITVGQAIVRGLYRFARFSAAVALATDKAVLYFHLHRDRTAIDPENEMARRAA